MIPRLAIEHLREWKSKPERKPLIIRGARHVGKTTLVEEFSTEYDNYLAFNLKTPGDKSIFDRFSDIDKLVQAMFLARQMPYEVHNTLVFIDEIQESPNTVVQLQNFFESYPSLHVIAAGSLIEHALSEIPSTPDEQVEHFVLHPVNFHEYLLAIGQMGILAAYLETPVPDYAHHRLMTVYNEYAIIGGMPEIAFSFLSDGDYTRLSKIYDVLLASYRDDILKYARNSTSVKVLRQIIQAAPHFADHRIKFERFGNSNYKSREVGNALRSLEFARVLRLIYPTTATEVPSFSDRKKSPRLQFLDTGLVNYSVGLQHALLGLNDLSTEHQGHVIKHLAVQELVSRHSSPSYESNFWVRKEAGSQAEVHFVYPFEHLLIPIEIKSGKPGRLRSLHQFMDQCTHSVAIRVYGDRLQLQTARTIKGKSFQLLNLPYYLAGRIPEYIAWLVKSAG